MANILTNIMLRDIVDNITKLLANNIYDDHAANILIKSITNEITNKIANLFS